MSDWGKKNRMKKEGRAVLKHLEIFKGYYLPYRIVRGPVEADVRRDETEREYKCRGYLQGTAVSTSKQLDNLVLDEMEPFDWSAARPFELGYIAGENVKLNDLSDKEISARIREETEADFLPEVERVMQTKGVSVDVLTGNLVTLTALLPVYFIKNRDLTAVMNGQTGRIAVSHNRRKVSWPWVIEPLLYTVVLTLLFGLWVRFNPELTVYAAVFFSIVIFSAMGEGRTSLIRDVILKSRSSSAYREEETLKFREGKNVLPENNPEPVFFEKNKKGEEVPVKIRFYSFSRWLSVLFSGLVTVFLPVILASLIRLAEMEPGEAFLDKFEPVYGGAWYIIAFCTM